VSNPEPLPAAPDEPAAQGSQGPHDPRERAIDLIQRGAVSSNALLRANSLQAMQYAPQHLKPLVQAGLVDENYGVRFIAAMLIGDEDLCDVSHLLEPLTRDESGSVRAAAIYGLRRCDRPVDLNPLAELILSDDPEVRGNTAMVLGRLGNPSAAPLIRQAVGRGMELVSEPRVKMVDLQLAEALVMLGDANEIEAIRAALFAPPEQGELTALACMICGRLRDYRVVPNLVRLALETGQGRRLGPRPDRSRPGRPGGPAGVRRGPEVPAADAGGADPRRDRGRRRRAVPRRVIGRSQPAGAGRCRRRHSADRAGPGT
jgi:hypothetical protein